MQKNFTRIVIPLLAIAIILILILHSRRNEVSDDAFITYRYTANLVMQHGFVYNEGEAVLGTTTPAYGFLLAIPALVWGWEQLPNISILINLLLLLITAINIYLITNRLTQQPILSILAASFVVVAPFTTLAAVSGMETALYLTILSGIFCAEIHKRSFISSLLAGWLIWVRPEGIFTIILLVGWYTFLWWKKELLLRKLTQLGILLIFPSILYILFLFVGYNTLLPQSIIAKSAGLYTINLKTSIYTVLVHTARYEDNLFYVSRSFAKYVAVIHYIIVLIGGIYLFRKRNFLMLVPALYLMHLAFYANSKTIIFWWYYANYELLEIISLLIGIYAIISFVFHLSKIRQFKDYLKKFSYILILVMLFINILQPPNQWQEYLQSSPEWPRINGRMQIYYQLLMDIEPHVPTNTRIMMPEIGILGFLMPDMYIMDAAGLVSTEAVTYFPVPQSERRDPMDGVIPIGYVHDYQPDMIITLEVFGAKGILEDEKFWEDYTAVIVWEGDFSFGSKALYVFSRNDFQAGMTLQNIEEIQSLPSILLPSQ